MCQRPRGLWPSNQAFDRRRQKAGSSGGGALTAAKLGQKQTTTQFEQGQEVESGENPATTVRAYLRAMKNRNARRDLDLYTSATQQMLAGWTVTPAQMDMTARTYSQCTSEPAQVNAQGRLAVVRYPPAQRQCAPWFLQKEGGRWRLDLTMMQKAVRFGPSNAWSFDLSVNHPYRFAFSDWSFDRLGFPQN